MDGAHHADRIGRVGPDGQDVRIGRLDRAHDRREVGGRRWIALVVDDLESHSLGVLAGAIGVGVRVLLVGIGDCDRLRLGVLRCRELEEALGEGLRAGTVGCDLEIPRIVELVVDREAQQRDEDEVALHHDRHGGRDLRRRVGADDEIDLVHVEKLRIDARHGRGLALVVVIDELHGPAQNAALGVDVLLPDLHCKERRLAVGREPAGQGHAEADLDGIGGARIRANERQHQRQRDRTEPREKKHRAFLQVWLIFPRPSYARPSANTMRWRFRAAQGNPLSSPHGDKRIGDMLFERDIAVAMRDGAGLMANVFRPAAGGRAPLIHVGHALRQGQAARPARHVLHAARGRAVRRHSRLALDRLRGARSRSIGSRKAMP